MTRPPPQIVVTRNDWQLIWNLSLNWRGPFVANDKQPHVDPSTLACVQAAIHLRQSMHLIVVMDVVEKRLGATFDRPIGLRTVGTKYHHRASCILAGRQRPQGNVVIEFAHIRNLVEQLGCVHLPERRVRDGVIEALIHTEHTAESHLSSITQMRLNAPRLPQGGKAVGVKFHTKHLHRFRQ